MSPRKIYFVEGAPNKFSIILEVLKSPNSSFLIFYKTSNIIIIISIATIINIFEPLLVVF